MVVDRRVLLGGMRGGDGQVGRLGRRGCEIGLTGKVQRIRQNAVKRELHLRCARYEKHSTPT
jgi:hypothetical protein